jgi:ornithine--oxo-acid transaminase
MTALNVLVEENLARRAEILGEKFRSAVHALNSPLVQTVRGKGLLNAVVINEDQSKGKTAWQLCLMLKSRGVLAKPTHVNMYAFISPSVRPRSHIASQNPFCASPGHPRGRLDPSCESARNLSSRA